MITEINDTHIYVKTTNAIGTQLDGTYLKSRDAWRLPLNLGALRDLYKLGYDVEELGKQLSQEYKQRLELKERDVSNANTKLRPYQMQDVLFLNSSPYAGVFNEQRSGKTPTVCKTVEYVSKKAVVVAPASLLLNWRDELHTWTELEAMVAMGTKKKREDVYKQYYANGGVLIVSKETLRNDINLIQSLGYDTVIVDEAHFLRNYNTKQSQAVYQLGKFAKRRYALTGTPATKSPADVYGILHFLDSTRWSSYWQFVERYFVVTDRFIGGKDIGGFKSKAREREYTEILNIISVQRKRKDVMQWLPQKQYQTVKLHMEAKQQKAYDDMLNSFEVEEIGLDAMTTLSQMLRLRQITSVPHALGLEWGAKFNFIKDWLENNEGEQVVIFSNFSSGLKEMHQQLLTSKIKSQLIIGDISKQVRNMCVDNFQQGKIQVLLCNIEAAGTGLTLDMASTVIFLDRHYNPAQNEQAEDRIVATTETSNLNALIIDLVCEGTIDEKILHIVKQKKDVTEVANNYKDIKEWLK